VLLFLDFKNRAAIRRDIVTTTTTTTTTTMTLVAFPLQVLCVLSIMLRVDRHWIDTLYFFLYSFECGSSHTQFFFYEYNIIILSHSYVAGSRAYTYLYGRYRYTRALLQILYYSQFSFISVTFVIHVKSVECVDVCQCFCVLMCACTPTYACQTQ